MAFVTHWKSLGISSDQLNRLIELCMNRSAARMLRSAYHRSASTYFNSAGEAMTTSAIETRLSACAGANFIPGSDSDRAGVNRIATAVGLS